MRSPNSNVIKDFPDVMELFRGNPTAAATCPWSESC
jgi:hypothetical protein